MENEKKSATNPQRDEKAATPIPIVETRLTISVHDGLTLPDEGKAQIPVRSAMKFSDLSFRANARNLPQAVYVTLTNLCEPNSDCEIPHSVRDDCTCR